MVNENANFGLIYGISCLKVPCSSKVAKAKKANPASNANTGLSGNLLPASLSSKSSTAVLSKVTSLPRNDEPDRSIVKSSNVLPSEVTSLPRSDKIVPSIAAVPASHSMEVSPTRSDANSVSMDETMSACDSFKSPDVEYIDNNDARALDSIDRNSFRNLYISDHPETKGNLVI